MMKGIPVALQIYTVRELAEADFAGTMKKVKEIGYDYVELAGLYGNTPQQIRKALDDAGLVAISAHVPYLELAQDMHKSVADYAAIGCKYLAVPYLTEEYRPGQPGFDQVVKMIPQIGEACKAAGMVLLYHNHDFEFARMPDGRYALDYLYETIGPDLLQTELDVCWVNVVGESPVEYIRKYAGRCPVIHLKDYYKEGNPKNLYQLIGIQGEESGGDTGRFEFRPVGYGVQVVPEIVTAGLESGASYFVVEQDVSVGRTPLEAAKVSRDYLRPLGI